MSTSTTSVVTPEPVDYPVHVDAELDPQVSRGLWLVKWLLVIPHYVVLAFLWAAFVVSSIVAFFAILFTARYPRALFDFNVGVMRWSWRVAYYAYGALGTDRYPPFTLAEVPDYPAHLTVDRPERPSRGLVLVKWWLLALPHYLVVAFFVGGVSYGIGDRDSRWWVSVSLIGLLVLVAGVVLLFSGRYPQPIFDLVLGLNRWVLRVAGYAALMTDRYPPFRLEMGGHEPGHATGPQVGPDVGTHRSGGVGWGSLEREASATPPAPPAQDPHLHATYARTPGPPSGASSGWTFGRVVSLVIGSLLVLGSLGIAGGAVTLAVVDQTARDADGFLTSPQARLATDGYAVVSEDSRIRLDNGWTRLPERVIGEVRLSAQSLEGGTLFVGVGPSDDVRAYLADVDHSTLLEVPGGDPVYRDSAGGAPLTAPTAQGFWVAEATGGDPEVVWTPEEGDWTAVLMNADGSVAVEADVAVGAEVPAVGTAVAVLGVTAAVLLALGAVLVAVPIRAASRSQ